MAFTILDQYTPCNWEKSQTCENKFAKCDVCNQTHERQGLTNFEDKQIQNYYKPDASRVKQFNEITKHK